MIKLKTIMAGVVIAALGVGLAIGQVQLVNRSMSGNEVVAMAQGGPGGPSIFVAAAQLRNAQGPATTALTSGTLSGLTPTTASLVFTAASVSTTVNLPASPYDGEIFEIINGSAGAFTQCTVAATDGATITGGASPTLTGALASGASTEWRYVLATTTWYRMR